MRPTPPSRKTSNGPEPRRRDARGAFLAVIALLAVAGVAFVVLSTRPAAAPSGTSASSGATRTISFTLNGQTQTVTGNAVTGDPAAGARFTLGQENAPVTVTEFANYQCHYCQLFNEDTKRAFISEFVDTGKARLAYRDLPFTGQANVTRASEAAACAAEQDRYWDYHDALYRVQQAWASFQGSALDSRLADYADQLGLDTTAFKTCLDSGRTTGGVNADVQAASQFGVTGTPAFFIGGYRYEGALPIEAMRDLVNRELNAAK